MDETNDRMNNQELIDEELMNELKKANNQTYYLGDNRDRSDSEDEFKNEIEKKSIQTFEKNDEQFTSKIQNNVGVINDSYEEKENNEYKDKDKNDSDDSEDESELRVKSEKIITSSSCLKINKKINKEYLSYDYEADSKDCEK